MINVALLQATACGGNTAANMAKGEALCRRAQQMGADIALFPEMWSDGYSFFDSRQPGSREAWQARAVDAQSDFVRHFQALARELDMAIALTYLEKWPGAPRNTVSIIDRHGEIVLTYAKVHTCDWIVENALTPGDDFYVCDLDTAQGTVKVGAMICYDREHPESARVLMLKGAELILTPNACTLDEPRIDQFQTRAYENTVGVAMANYAAPQNNGHSAAFNPVAYVENVAAQRPLIVEAGENEGIYLAPFDLDRIRSIRESGIWGPYRKPRAYGLLTSMEVPPPFVRQDARK